MALDEHQKEIRITSIVSIAATISILAVFGTVAFGCHEYSRMARDTYRSCVEAGGTYLADRWHCVATRPRP